ncbi:M23 family metallopeptidase [Plantactinospora veratri]|uniref:M23 family metallopeptidase n=1 Tax=Plantactinospora veratri TaxID=1436122 RepID=A0ABU7SA03_9ACTN
MTRRWHGAGPAILLSVLLLALAPPPAAETDPTGRSVRDVGSPARFRWPLDGVPPVVRRFDPPPRPWAAGHRGVDLAAPPGATVRAAGPGVVFFAGTVADRPLVSVAHANGLRTTYEPVRSGLAAGDAVRAGDPLGVLQSGHRGCTAAGAACLHWGLRRGDEYLDPLLLLGLGRVRLLPVSAQPPAGAAGR